MSVEITPDSTAKGNGPSVSDHKPIDEKTTIALVGDKEGPGVTAASFPLSEVGSENDRGSDEVIIITGADAAAHLLPMRDDGDAAATFRSILLASGLSCFQAVMNQIYNVSSSDPSPMHQVLADTNSRSSNPRRLASKELSSSSSPISSEKRGPRSYLVVITLRLDGERREITENYPGGSKL